MNADKLFNLAGLIVGVAMVTTIVTNSGSQAVIRSVGDAFSGSLRAAMGK